MSAIDHTICKCNQEGYALDCPLAFMQGGVLLHPLSHEMPLKPRKYDPPQPAVCQSRVDQRKTDDVNINPYVNDSMIKPKEFGSPHSSSSTFSSDAFIEVERFISDSTKHQHDPSVMTIESAQSRNRASLNRYEPLKIGGKSLTAASIGGYTLDFEKATEQAKKVVPLPPAKLPKIYIDEELNFYHHFFQGLERLIGREVLVDIANADKHFVEGTSVVFPLIMEIVSSGHEQQDTTLTVFTKSILSSTFEMEQGENYSMRSGMLNVAANLWGFQYLEPGMQCREADLRMWLSLSYSHFRTLFFNSFKDSGMPAFALEGVQRRYEAHHIIIDEDGKLSRGKSLVQYDVPRMKDNFHNSDVDVQSMRSSRRRHRHRKESTIGSFLMGKN